MSAYYSEHDPFAAAWLRELIADGRIADGEVDERDIQTLDPDDLRGFSQCHFFAGIGGWSYALRLAGWPDDDRFIWTGSCPCQPFSSAGTQAGGTDPRHLWPAWYHLIRECRPPVIFGEQVESAVAHGWLDRVCDDLEREGYAVGALSLPAASVGAPHIRQRLWFVADALDHRTGRPTASQPRSDGAHNGVSGEDGAVNLMADADRGRLSQCGERDRDTAQPRESTPRWDDLGGRGADEQLCQSLSTGSQRLTGDGNDRDQPRRLDPAPGGSTATTGVWDDLIWLPCRDGKARPTQPKYVKMVNGISSTMVPMRGQVISGWPTPIKSEKDERPEDWQRRREIMKAKNPRLGDLHLGLGTVAHLAGGNINGQAETTRPDQILRGVSRALATEDVQVSDGGQDDVQQAAVLQSSLHGEMDEGSDQEHDATEQPQAVSEDGENNMSTLPSETDATLRASLGREPAEQREDQSLDGLRLLPSSLAFAQLYGDAATEEAVQFVLAAYAEEGIVLDAQHPTGEVWRSLSNESQDRVRVAFAASGLVRTFDSPLAHGVPARVGRLRGYGNAIVPQVAAEVIRAYWGINA